MIKVSHCVPIEYLERFKDYSSMHLLLAQLVASSEEYREFFYNKTDNFKIMDNGAAELGKSFTESDLIDLALSVRADCLVAPDVIYDFKGTLEATSSFLHKNISKISQHRLKILVVPQGKTIWEYFRCAEELIKLAKKFHCIEYIGISYISAPYIMSEPMKVPWKRVECLRPYVVQLLEDLTELKNLKVHLLGCGNPIEYAIYRSFANVVSADSSVAFQFALNGIEVNSMYGAPREVFLRADQKVKSFDFYMKNVPEEVLNLAEKNMKVINSIAKGGNYEETQAYTNSRYL